MSGMPVAGSYDIRGIQDLELSEMDLVGGGMTASQAASWGDAAAAFATAAAMCGAEPIAAAAYGFAAGCYIGAAVMG